LFGVQPTAAAPLIQEAAREEAKAVQEHEQVDVNLAARKLASEVAHRMSYEENVKNVAVKKTRAGSSSPAHVQGGE
jgi:hypothetical protein